MTDNTLLIFLSDNGGLSITYQSGYIFDDIGSDGIPEAAPDSLMALRESMTGPFWGTESSTTPAKSIIIATKRYTDMCQNIDDKAYT